MFVEKNLNVNRLNVIYYKCRRKIKVSRLPLTVLSRCQVYVNIQKSVIEVELGNISIHISVSQSLIISELKPPQAGQAINYSPSV